MTEKVRDLEQHFVFQIAAVSILLGGCTDFDAHMARCKAHAISEDQAKAIALKFKGINNPADYTFDISSDENGYFVYYNAKDESRVPSFGTVALDFCGEILGSAGPL